MLVIGSPRQTPIYVQAVGADSISARYARAPTGASGTPPPTRNRTVAVGQALHARWILRCRQTARANTVRPYAPFAVSIVGRGHLAITAA